MTHLQELLQRMDAVSSAIYFFKEMSHYFIKENRDNVFLIFSDIEVIAAILN